MALIQCPDCRKDVSDIAPTCPRCGRPVCAPAQGTTGPYRSYTEIERVSGNLFRNGNYAQAALEAYTRVINEVKRRSKWSVDGQCLINQAFAWANTTPLINFSSLDTWVERNEQEAFLFLFKGIASLQAARPSSDRLFSDPAGAHEYLALASFLMSNHKITFRSLLQHDLAAAS